MPLLGVGLLYVENLLALPLLRLWMSLVSTDPLSVFVGALKLLALILLFKTSVEVVIGPTILLELSIYFFFGAWFLSS